MRFAVVALFALVAVAQAGTVNTSLKSSSVLECALEYMTEAESIFAAVKTILDDSKTPVKDLAAAFKKCDSSVTCYAEAIYKFFENNTSLWKQWESECEKVYALALDVAECVE